jgi:cytochrome c2
MKKIFGIRIIYYAVVILPIIALVLGYLYSIVSYRKNLFPYPQLKSLYTEISHDYNAEQLHEQTRIELTEVSVDIDFEGPVELGKLVSGGRIIESLTVPFLMREIDIASLAEFGLPSIKGPGGGVCAAKNSLVLFGGEGNGILIDLDSLRVTGQVALSGRENKAGAKFFGVNDVICDRSDDPKFVYVAYQIIHPELADSAAPHRTLVARIDLKDFQTSAVTDVWSSALSGPNYAGRLAILDSGRLLVSFSDSEPYGERQANGLFRPEDPDRLEGKIVLADLSTGEGRIYSSGHRNPQGLFITRDGKIYETEHGPKGGDELNLIVQGENYGWPHESHGVDYGSYRWMHGNPGRHDHFHPPVFAWVPSIAASNLLQVENFHSSWAGDFLISSLKAQSLFRLRLNAGHGVEFVEQIWVGSRIRDLTELDESGLALWTDASKLVLLSVAEKFLQGDRRTTTTILGNILQPCTTCHHFGITNETHLAPSLSMILSRDIASDNFTYSEALAGQKGKWTPELLKAFIMDPQALVPGSAMTFKVEDEAQADAIVERLVKVDKMGQ